MKKSRASRGRRWTWALGLGLLALTVGRIFLAWQDGVNATEAYFWLLGERWAWASFEGPGGAPALVAGLRIFLGPHPEVLGVLSPLAVLLASVGLWAAARSWTSPAWAAAVVAAWNVLPGVQTASLTFGTEPLLWACWTGFLALASRAVRSADFSFFWWLLAGMLAAAGVLISYTFLLAPLGVVLFWLSERKFWRHLARWIEKKSRRRPGWLRGWVRSAPAHPEAGAVNPPADLPPREPRLSLGSGWWLTWLGPGLALTGPVLWQIETGWVALAGFTWQSLTNFGGGEAVIAALGTTAAAGGWFLFGGLLLAWVLLQHTALREKSARWWVLLALLPGGWMLLTLWRGEPATAAFLLWAAVVLPGWAAWHKEWSGRSLAWFSAGTAGLVLLTAGFGAWTLLRTPAQPEPAWATLAERVQRVAHMFQPAGEAPLFLVAGEADTAAALGFYLLQRETGAERDFPPVYLKESQNVASQFGLWPRYDAFIDAPVVVVEGEEIFTEQKGRNPNLGRSALYIGTEAPPDLPQVIANGFAQVVPLERVRDPSGRVFYLYFCRDYQTAPL